MLQDRLVIDKVRLDEVNDFIKDPDNRLVKDLLAIVERFGGPEEINRKAKENGKVENLMARLEEKGSPYVADLKWLMEQRDSGAYISINDYRRKVLGDKASEVQFNEDMAVTLEISAAQYFSDFMKQARQAQENQNRRSDIDDSRPLNRGSLPNGPPIGRNDAFHGMPV